MIINAKQISSKIKAYRGKFVNPIAINQTEYIADGLIVVQNGVIVKFLKDSTAVDQYIACSESNDYELEILSEDEFMVPGFVDTHTHAPQFINMGVGSDLQLLDWLQEYTFPGEKQFESLQFATLNYKLTVDLTVNNGTTTCLYFGTIFTESTLVLCDIIEEKGQRGFVGKVCMDNESFCPDYYVETTEDSIRETKKFISKVDENAKSLVRPVITPRFALSCTPSLMKELSMLAKQHDLLIQSHLSENQSECELVGKQFPRLENYSRVYDEYGLLECNTIMAHCIHLSDAECQLLLAKNVGIAHCPSSNCNLRSGRMPLRKYIDMGMKVGLGTDVSGGSSPSILRAIQDAYLIHKLDSHRYVTYEELFYLATLGGAKLLRMDQQIGNFAVGKCFDALLIRNHTNKRSRVMSSCEDNQQNSVTYDYNYNVCQLKSKDFYNYNLNEMFENFMLNGCENDIISVIVNGKTIK